MHNDEPVLLDALDRVALIHEVGDAIASCTPPQVFGVHGDWGLGKTSFLHQVQWYLTGDCPQQPEEVTAEMKKVKEAETDASVQRCGVYKDTVQAVWFDAWRYQNEVAPVVALLHEMRAQLSWGSRAIRSAGRNTKVLVRGALLSMEELTKKIGFQYSKFDKANREWGTENLAAALPSHTLREHLCAAVGQLLPKKKTDKGTPKLVVFIDDVDRCEPEAAYRLLEGLKIYLTLDNCVFVLGMNQKAIIEAIDQRMEAIDQRMGAIGQRTEAENGSNPSMRAAAYMEKLCQNVWRLPAIRQPVQALYDLLEETVENDNVRNSIKKVLEETSPYPCLPPNPRRLKGLANLLGRLSSLIPSELSPEEMVFETQLLVIVAYVYQFHHDLYVRWEFNPRFYNKIHDWCEQNDPQHPVFRQMERPLRRSESDSAGLTASASTDFESTYPDPAEANVFWIQSLILRLGSEISPSRFERYLHGVAT